MRDVKSVHVRWVLSFHCNKKIFTYFLFYQVTKNGRANRTNNVYKY